MTQEERSAILEGAKIAFFEAMLDGYVGDWENSRSKKFKFANGCTMIIYETRDGKYEVVDQYCKNDHSGYSAGTTTIFQKEASGSIRTPIWWMSYGGYYLKEAIPFLKVALKQAYQQNLFCHGRGPRDFIDTNLGMIYQNIGTGDFEEFEGEENISDTYSPAAFGSHKYFGMSLL